MTKRRQSYRQTSLRRIARSELEHMNRFLEMIAVAVLALVACLVPRSLSHAQPLREVPGEYRRMVIEGAAAIENGDLAKAVYLLEPIARQGYTDAEHLIGLMVHHVGPEGLPISLADVMSWLRQAAEHGHAGAQLKLGLILRAVPESFDSR